MNTLRIESLVAGGRGVGRLEGRAVFIRVLAKAGPAGAAELRLPVGRFAQLQLHTSMQLKNVHQPFLA